jgi:MFS family permease
MRGILRSSLDHGLLNPPVRWMMLAAPFGAGVSIYGFYAVQPYLLELYGSEDSYAIAGLAAALIAGTQIAGGTLVGQAAKLFRRRTSLLFVGSAATVAVLALIGLVANFWVVLALMAVWGVLFAVMLPVRQAFLNGLIPSAQRATVLSSDNLLSSAGGVVVQPALGKVADVWSYGISYVVGAGIQLLALPLVILARREGAPSDPIEPVRSERRRARLRRHRATATPAAPARPAAPGRRMEAEGARHRPTDGPGEDARRVHRRERVDVHGWDEGLPVPANAAVDEPAECADEAQPPVGCGQP